MSRGFIAGSSRKVLAWGTVVAVVITTLLFFALNAPQCPENYTQEQINASNCIVGANIGIGLLVVSIPIIWAISIYVTGSFINIRGKEK